jgi:hypothetical protein
MLRRLATKYGDAINITTIRAAQGYIHDSPPLSLAQEGREYSQFVTDKLHLPITVAIQQPRVQKLPDGRRLIEKAPYQQNAYYSNGLILTDQSGKLIVMLPGTMNEKQLEAWIDRALGRGATTAQ